MGVHTVRHISVSFVLLWLSIDE